MGSGFSKMKKQSRMWQEQMTTLRTQLDSTEATGQSGGGLVTIILSGGKEIKKVSIKPECVDPNDVTGLEDLIQAAFQDASRKLDSSMPADAGSFLSG